MTRPRLLVVTERFWPEDFIINDLVAELAGEGVDVTVLTQQPSYPKDELFPGYKNRLLSQETWKGSTIVRFRTVLGYRRNLSWKLWNYFWFMGFGSLVARYKLPKFDSVFIYQTGPLTMAIPGLVAGRAWRKSIAIWTQDVWPDSVYAYGFKRSKVLEKVLDTFVRWVYGRVDRVLISCPGFREILHRYTSKPCIFAPNWPMIPYTPTSRPGEGGGPIFLFAGNVGKVQNLENVIRGFALATAEDSGLGILRITGDGSALDDLRALAADLGAPVEFPGRKPASEMSAEFDAADALILSLADKPVFHLTLPAKFQMYLSVGKPILCAAGGEVARMVKDSDLGIVTDPDSPVAIAEGFRALAAATLETRQRWRENAATVLSEQFDRATIINRIRETLGPEFSAR